VELVYSAHSLPVSFINEGDPYVDHLQRTITAVEEITGVQGRICYQSRSGPVEWLSPSTPEMIKTLGNEGCVNILMVPISFVSDHVETLVEINMDYKELAAGCGIRLETSQSFNDDPDFIDALKNLVLQALEDN
jgi:ferrochelatase